MPRSAAAILPGLMAWAPMPWRRLTSGGLTSGGLAVVRLGGAGLSAAGLLLACAAPPAESPHAERPLDQALARELIREAIRAEGALPSEQVAVALPRSHQLTADVGVEGHKLAVAFVTGSERQELGSSVPAYDVGSNALQLVRDSGDPDVRVLVLHDLGYMTDEQTGEDREVSSVVVKHRLQRDVRDFLAEARKRGWP